MEFATFFTKKKEGIVKIINTDHVFGFETMSGRNSRTIPN